MTLRGKVKNGKVLLADPNALPNGTNVEVRPVKKKRAVVKPTKGKSPPRRSRAERLASFIGAVKDLPSDMSVNLDHYLYGHPKQQ